jgi:DNA invertase Pin-like site-specific DNA recombinase
MKKIRCAIYTRKSTEEGLEQDFNSLHAQREACSAYVLSQASEGWSLLGEEYNDGGLSGGTLERPALRRLLADIDAGKVDIVVVYKVDRLTRSLLDFSKLVEAFDRAGTSFVSVTQSFNTTTSMGRLTLNMLLSFAQFEREVTAERIRDKIAASKAKGMWMGGFAPLGFRQAGRTLEIVRDQADLVRSIFRRYLELGTVRLLVDQLSAEGMTVPRRTTASGRSIGGGAFGRGQLYAILTKRIYIGEIEHKGQIYQGQHQAIVERTQWDGVRDHLAQNTRGKRPGANVKFSACSRDWCSMSKGSRSLPRIPASRPRAGQTEARFGTATMSAKRSRTVPMLGPAPSEWRLENWRRAWRNWSRSSSIDPSFSSSRRVFSPARIKSSESGRSARRPHASCALARPRCCAN